METKKKYIILALCAVAFAVIIFGALQFSKAKKTIEINVENLNVDDAQQEIVAVAENKEEVIIDQPALSSSSVDKQVGEQPIISKKEEKVAESAVEEKIAVEKAVEPEKPATNRAESGDIVNKLISWGFTKASDRKIDTIIIHSSYDALGSDPYSVSGIIEEYKQYEVSAHYLIARDGIIYRLVADDNIAWHAGVAKMPDGHTNVNSFSIGIEMINTLDGKYTDAQYIAVNALISSLKKKYAIDNILGHNEIAPGRKTDPWGISWTRVQK